MNKILQFKILDNPKYKLLEAKHLFDSEGYQIFIDGKIRYCGVTFNQHDLKIRLDYLKRYLKLEEIPVLNSDEKIKRHRRTKSEMSLFRRGLEIIKSGRGRGRPKGSLNKTK